MQIKTYCLASFLSGDLDKQSWGNNSCYLVIMIQRSHELKKANNI